jgi:NTP pyrophosphatase (non-canonical NTP hydrolase)
MPEITREAVEAAARKIHTLYDTATADEQINARETAVDALSAAVPLLVDAAALVLDFHLAFRLPIGDTTRTHNELRAKLIREEAEEAADAVEYLGLTEQAKELADLVIVAYGAALTLGIDLDQAVRLVHASNMTKLGADGEPVMRADGKVLKGPNYTPPNMVAALPRGGA